MAGVKQVVTKHLHTILKKAMHNGELDQTAQPKKQQLETGELSLKVIIGNNEVKTKRVCRCLLLVFEHGLSLLLHDMLYLLIIRT